MNFIAIDFETANPNKNSAISVGLVRYDKGVKADSFYTLIKPRKNLKPSYFYSVFTEIHRLSYDDVKDAPLFSEIWESGLKEWFSLGLPFCAHNGNTFDMKVLSSVFKKNGINFPQVRYFDSLWIARRTWDFPNYRLTTIAEIFGIDYDAHNALADAETCGDIIIKAAEKHKSPDISSLLKCCSQSIKILDNTDN